MTIGEDQHADHADDRGYCIAEFLDLPQKRSFERAHFCEQLVDAAEFRLAARRHDDARRAAGYDHCAGERHTLAVSDRRVFGNRIGVLLRRHGLASERRFFGAQVLRLDEPQVRRNLVARFEEHDVPRNEFIRGKHAGLAAAHGPGLGGEHVADRIQRFLGFPFLDEPEEPVENHDGKDDRRVDP